MCPIHKPCLQQSSNFNNAAQPYSPHIQQDYYAKSPVQFVRKTNFPTWPPPAEQS